MSDSRKKPPRRSAAPQTSGRPADAKPQKPAPEASGPQPLPEVKTADDFSGVSRARRRGTAPQSSDFAVVSLMMKLFGGMFILPGLLVMFGSVGWGLIVAAPGTLLLVIGIGVGRYQPWAWYAAVVAMLPLSIVITLATLIAAGLTMNYIWMVVLWPLFCAYVAWILLSNSGRQRYFETGDAIARARENPDSMAGRRYRR